MKKPLLSLLLMLTASAANAGRTETLLCDWEFHKGEDSGVWEKVTVPHDWAITGPFSRENDIQTVQVVQDGEKKASLKTGRTGGLPYIGTGWYRTRFSVPGGKCAELLFDGVMSGAVVYVNGREVISWPNGYNAFHADVTAFLKKGENLLEVRAENLPRSSRWYPGAGIFRNVHLIVTDRTHIPVWGTHVTTSGICPDEATVNIDIEIENPEGPLDIGTDIISPDGRKVAEATGKTQRFKVRNPLLWSPESPSLYRAETTIRRNGKIIDSYTTTFGIRTVEFIPHKGFFLNGKPTRFKGVCNHHDLGPLGAAVNESALRHRLSLLKDMGCNAIRTSHNMPSPELVRLCNEMGFMMMVEAFDEWDVAKCENGYHRHFARWAEKDLVNMVHHFRNDPCVVLWSIGNEVPTQCRDDGWKTVKYLQDIVHREDPSRLCTCGMDRLDYVLDNGFARAVDVPGLNYRTFKYSEAYDRLPQGFILGSETGSTVSSRGVYKLPAQKRFSAVDADHQCSAYELDACLWSNVPDIDLALSDRYPWVLGQFVWTGFDYLGEPSPYDRDNWPNHSSMFGIIDLASIPKDRYYLFRSVWNTSEHTLHLLPHWNWEGHEGESIPVMLFTDSPSAELFLNGKSLGIRRKAPLPDTVSGAQDENLEPCYRLRWEVPYSPGELKATAYNADGSTAGETTVRTASAPHHLKLEASTTCLKADGKDICYVTVSIVDRQGNLCPKDSRLLNFKVSGAASFKAVANGDPTCTESFQANEMHAFGGKLTVLVCSSANAGPATLHVGAEGLEQAELKLEVKR